MQPSAQLVIKDTVGSVGAYALVMLANKLVKPDPEKFWDELAVAAIPLATAFFIPPKYARQGAALSGAAMYPLMLSLARQVGITE